MRLTPQRGLPLHDRRQPGHAYRLCAIPYPETLPSYVTVVSWHPTLENALMWARRSGLASYPTGRQWIDHSSAPATWL